MPMKMLLVRLAAMLGVFGALATMIYVFGHQAKIDSIAAGTLEPGAAWPVRFDVHSSTVLRAVGDGGNLDCYLFDFGDIGNGQQGFRFVVQDTQPHDECGFKINLGTYMLFMKNASMRAERFKVTTQTRRQP
jgi:hypothetical protein